MIQSRLLPEGPPEHARCPQRTREDHHIEIRSVNAAAAVAAAAAATAAADAATAADAGFIQHGLHASMNNEQR